MGKLRREIINVFNATVVSGRHVDEFNDLMTAVLKETRSFMKEAEQYKKDQKLLEEQLREHDELRRTVLEEANTLAGEQSPLVTVLQFTVKSELDAWAAKEHGIELDGRKDLAFMQVDFAEKYKANTNKETK